MIKHKVLEEHHLYIINEEDTQRINEIESNLESNQDGEAGLFDEYTKRLDPSILEVEWEGDGQLRVVFNPNRRTISDFTMLSSLRKYIEGEVK